METAEAELGSAAAEAAWEAGAVRGVCSGAATTVAAAEGTADNENRERPSM